MTREALKLALEALEGADWYINQLELIVYSVDDEGTHENRAKVQSAITAIKEALAPTRTQCEVQDEQSSSQEPVAHRDGFWCADLTCKKCYSADFRFKHTSPPKRQPLTLNEISAMEEKVYMRTTHKGKPLFEYAQALIRAVEAAHGIKENT